MKFVVSLITNPTKETIGPELLERFLAVLEPYLEAGHAVEELSPGEAYDIALVEHPRPDFLPRIAEIAVHARVDANVVPAANRRKKLLIADMDSTIIEQECIDELAEFAGKRKEISEITAKAMRGELDFEGALTERVAMLKGLSESVLEETFAKRITLTPGAETLVKTMNERGGVTALVSGGFTFFTSRIAKRVGFVHQQANELLIEEGRLSGKVKLPILGQAAKLDALEALSAKHNVPMAETMAVGDGANDLAMLGRSGLGVAFHAKPAVAQSAEARIHHGDLTALLYLQGIPKSEFIR
ncbi:phosphoserine phosphatase SerB [Hyphococcus sp.]|jgi:phosphoserine phosphatase|uniref:phosphoserine phosphatase SerB n=1 Tax=Hyphococcus sp. TaxID=2038636 RepID=UPI003D14AE90